MNMLMTLPRVLITACFSWTHSDTNPEKRTHSDTFFGIYFEYTYQNINRLTFKSIRLFR